MQHIHHIIAAVQTKTQCFPCMMGHHELFTKRAAVTSWGWRRNDCDAEALHNQCAWCHHLSHPITLGECGGEGSCDMSLYVCMRDMMVFLLLQHPWFYRAGLRGHGSHCLLTSMIRKKLVQLKTYMTNLHKIIQNKCLSIIAYSL